MLNEVTIGQYFPANSILHRLDARIKLILVILGIVIIFLCGGLLSLSFAAAGVLTLALISGIPLRMYLRTLKTILPIIILTSALNAIYVEGEPIFKWWIITVTDAGAVRAAEMSVRIFLMIIISSVLTYTTSPTDLTAGMERLLSPLRFIGLENAVHILAMMMTIALRFIPTLIEEAEKTMNAQKARGANLDSGGPLKRVRAVLPVLIPLLISAVRRAIELADAMECRCYTGGKGRTRMRIMKLETRDYLALTVFTVFCSAVLILNYLKIL